MITGLTGQILARQPLICDYILEAKDNGRYDDESRTGRSIQA